MRGIVPSSNAFTVLHAATRPSPDRTSQTHVNALMAIDLSPKERGEVSKRP